MSRQAVTDFLQKVSEDQALQADLAKALQADNDREAVTTLGNQKGYDFTSDELWEEVQKRQAEIQAQADSGELSDEELEAISGGLSPLIFITLAAQVSVSVSVAATTPTW
ncbi:MULTISPECIES: Nif11-like leader peptide family natural product precursor [Leptolyngbya]|uniref:Nif11-like leader peptide family natural product precursor n=1 Tax=Leptolyngbya TaxID=47251 RepID=UPI0016868803|nr:Nif11-like leader peptide family natural product precursor [Leptolyngbya sp. FACHB-1624]MBD1856130.1 Nif11-like leader peptide family natural product precursor [Leptolyngbya sp. FACHB-1624]